MDKVVNYFLLLIIFVFDPLAIALVVASNMAFAQIRKPEEFIVSSKGIDPKDVKGSVPPGLDYNIPYTMDQIAEAFRSEEPRKEKITYKDFVEKHYPQKEIDIVIDDDSDKIIDTKPFIKKYKLYGELYTKQDLIDMSKNIQSNDNVKKDVQNLLQDNQIHEALKLLEKINRKR